MQKKPYNVDNEARSDFELVKTALDNPGKKQELRTQMSGLVEDMAARYADVDSSKSGFSGWKERVKKSLYKAAGKTPADKVDLTAVGWEPFELALKNYHDSIKDRLEKEGELFRFSTYLSWYVRRSIREYIEIENPGV